MMHYWFRPSIHPCDSPDADRAIYGATVTGASPTVRPLPDGVDLVRHFEECDAEVCGNCRRVHSARNG